MHCLGFLRRHSRHYSSSTATPFGAIASGGTFRCVRDRGLDHAVEREKNLIPFHNTIDLLASEPSKSLPISAIADRRQSLAIPFRPIEFLRRYPSVFRESAGIHPHFSLTDRALDLRSDESLMYSSDSYKNNVAARVLKLLMLCRANRMPLAVLRRLRWDLGLPQDFETSVLPDFPDYFRLTGTGDSRVLELVCWIKEFAVSAMEKEGNLGVFPVQYTSGFEMDKKYRKWVEDWQKLPYLSPYEDNASRFPSSAVEESDRWAAAVLHEALHILVPKKTEKENVLCLGEWLGLRSRFKTALLRHPGIFYVSSKNYTYTVVLKEGYRRGALVESHPLMSMRSNFIRLMNSSPAEENDKQASKRESAWKEEEEEDSGEETTEVELLDSSDYDEDEEEDVEQGVGIDSRRTRKRESMLKGHAAKRGRCPREKRERVGAKVSLETEKKGPSSREGSTRPSKKYERQSAQKEEEDSGEEIIEDEDVERGVGIDGRRSGKRDSMVEGRDAKQERRPWENRERVDAKVSLQTEKKGPSLRGRSTLPSKKNKRRSAWKEEEDSREEKIRVGSLDSSNNDEDEEVEHGVGTDRRRKRKRDSMVKGRDAKREKHPRENAKISLKTEKKDPNSRGRSTRPLKKYKQSSAILDKA